MNRLERFVVENGGRVEADARAERARDRRPSRKRRARYDEGISKAKGSKDDGSFPGPRI